MFDLNSSRLWRVTWSFFSQHTSDQLLRDTLKEHFMKETFLRVVHTLDTYY